MNISLILEITLKKNWMCSWIEPLGWEKPHFFINFLDPQSPFPQPSPKTLLKSKMTTYISLSASLSVHLFGASSWEAHAYAHSFQSYLTLCDPMDCNPPGSSVHGILQAGILEWVAISSFRGSSPSRDLTQVSWIAGRFLTILATKEALD